MLRSANKHIIQLSNKLASQWTVNSDAAWFLGFAWDVDVDSNRFYCFDKSLASEVYSAHEYCAPLPGLSFNAFQTTFQWTKMQNRVGTLYREERYRNSNNFSQLWFTKNYYWRCVHHTENTMISLWLYVSCATAASHHATWPNCMINVWAFVHVYKLCARKVQQFNYNRGGMLKAIYRNVLCFFPQIALRENFHAFSDWPRDLNTRLASYVFNLSSSPQVSEHVPWSRSYIHLLSQILLFFVP